MSIETREVALRAADGTQTLVGVEWTDGKKEAAVVIAANPLTGAPPLLDRTSYALDLSGLTSELGALLEPNQHLSEGALRFTTGVFDALLNHACGHVQLGPFDNAIAADSPGPLAVATDTGHVNYTITLLETAAGYAGFTRVRTLLGRHYHFFFDRAVPLAIARDGEPELSLPVVPAAAACAGITHRAVWLAEADEELFLHFGSSAEPRLHMIVEIVSAGS